MKLRKRASFWVSVTIGLALLGVACVPMLSHELGMTTHPQSSRRSDSCGGDGGSVYPTDLILTKPYEDSDHKYAVALHCIGIFYMLIGLNTVCDVYFSGALEVMVEVYEVQPDVAGATFMAAGGSAPELFTSLIGVFAESDVGFGTIVGSAVFNVLFVIGLCGWFAKGDIHLTVWPLFRDCCYYVVGLSVLALCASDEVIRFWEGALLFCLYLIYLLIMWKNVQLEAWAVAKFALFSLGHTKELAAPETAPGDAPAPEAEEAGDQKLDIKGNTGSAWMEMGAVGSDVTPPGAAYIDQKEDLAAGIEHPQSKEEEEEEEDDEEEEHILDIPEEGFDKFVWYVCCPIYFLLHYTTPEPVKAPSYIPFVKGFTATFFVSLLWIACFSYLLVWWTELLGEVIGIDTIIMGFTLLAAGTSIPDAVSSVHFAAIGEGDMAISSSIGSNIFDILVGLPIPWMIKTGIVEPIKDGALSTVTICSPYITFHVLVLLFMVLAVVVSIHLQHWRLNRPLGLIMGLLYLVFLVLACTVEFSEPEWLKF